LLEKFEVEADQQRSQQKNQSGGKTRERPIQGWFHKSEDSIWLARSPSENYRVDDLPDG
jgi:hypothetical protein